MIRPSTSLLHGTAAEGARGCTHAGAVGCWRQRGTPWGPGSLQRVRSGSQGCHLVVAHGTAPRGPGGLGKPSSTPARLLQPGPDTHTHSHLPAFSLSPATTYLPWERQLLPRLQCSRLSLQHRGEYPLAPRRPQAGRREESGTGCVLGSFTQTTMVLPGLASRESPRSREDSTHPLLLVWSCLLVSKVLGEGPSLF